MILDKPIIAVDFDGTITKKDNRVWNNNISSNDIMQPRDEIINWLKKHREKMYIILWTCRYGHDLKKAVEYCLKKGIKFDRINENIVKYPTSNKIMADFYLDDKGFNCIEKISEGIFKE